MFQMQFVVVSRPHMGVSFSVFIVRALGRQMVELGLAIRRPEAG